MSKKSAKKKAKTAKAPVPSPAYKTEKAKKVAKPFGRPSTKAPGNGVIKVLSAKNPKRVGSAACARFDLYKPNMTVAQFLKAGGIRPDLLWDEKQGFIQIENPS